MSNYPKLFLNFVVFIFFFVPSILNAQWSSDPNSNTPICIDTLNQREVDILSDGLGGAYLVWRDHRYESNVLYGDLYMQRINSNGIKLWDSGGVVLMNWANGQFAPIAVTDTNYGAYMIWEQNHGGFYNTELMAQRVDTTSTPYWSGMGMPIVQISGSTEYFHQAIPDGIGGVIIAWQRLPSFPGTTNIYAQRLIDSGAPQWQLNGLGICEAAENQTDVTLCSDGTGGAFIAWTDWRSGMTNLDIYAQHVSATGLVSFLQDGIAFCNESGNQDYPIFLESNNPSEAYLIWHDSRNSNGDIFAQKIDTSGSNLWPFNGIPLCNELHEQNNAAAIPDGSGGFIVTWTDLRDDSGNIYAQRVDANVVNQWTTNGVPVCSASGIQDESVVIQDGSGGAIIAWQDYRNDAMGDIYAQRINANGQLLWNTGGVAICTATGEQYNPVLITDGSGGAIIAWDDGRRGIQQFDIYAQWVDYQGNLAGVPNSLIKQENIVLNFDLYQNYPNPFNPSTQIKFDLPKTSLVQVNIHNALGKKIESLVNRTLQPGKYQFIWKPKNLASGIYFYSIQTEDFRSVKKMLLVK